MNLSPWDYWEADGKTPKGQIGDAMWVAERNRQRRCPSWRQPVVGKAIAKRYPGLQLGGQVTFARGEWEVVGVLA
jgi:hypothetical protein